MADSDPTKDPKFKQVVDHFLKTPPKPHKRKKDKEATEADRPATAATDQARNNGGNSGDNH